MENKTNVLITGGAGFIGSNLVEHFLNDKRVGLVRVLDNLSNGYLKNIEPYLNNDRFEFIEGDIRDYQICLKACEGIDKISHQAALGSVPRSIEDPMSSAAVNILGTVNLLYAAVQQNIERVVLAFSSSTYGDNPNLPKVEEITGNPLSPYAVTKASIEQFAHVFGKTYGLKWIGLRYFNIFGPKQNPNNPYAAVIPIFVKAFLEGGEIVVNGDGETSRDFTYVKNAVQMNELSLFTEDKSAMNQTYNTACSDRISLNEMIDELISITGKKIKVTYGKERPGDVKHSEACIQKARNLLGYNPEMNFKEGLVETINWHKSFKPFE